MSSGWAAAEGIQHPVEKQASGVTTLSNMEQFTKNRFELLVGGSRFAVPLIDNG